MPWLCNRCHEYNRGDSEECWNCEAPKGWEYEPPEPDYNAPGAAERAEMADRARRLK